MKASVIVVAAGSGTRLARPEPKAFVTIGGRTMLAWSLATIAKLDEVVEAVIAVPAGMESRARAEVVAAKLETPVKISPGGAERQDSVRIALALTSVESDLVLVHDAARPFAPLELWRECLRAAERSGGAIAAIPVADTLKRVVDGAIAATVARAGLWQAQTPQAFRREVLIAAHRRAVDERIVATDDADLVERSGGRVEVIEGSTANIKITTPSDLAITEAIIAAGMVE